MDRTAGSPLLEMKDLERQMSVDNPRIVAKKSTVTNPLLRWFILGFFTLMAGFKATLHWTIFNNDSQRDNIFEKGESHLCNHIF